MTKDSFAKFPVDQEHIRKEKFYLTIMFAAIVFVSLLAIGIVIYLTFFAPKH